MHVTISVALGWLTSEERYQMLVYSLSPALTRLVFSALMDGVLLLL